MAAEAKSACAVSDETEDDVAAGRFGAIDDLMTDDDGGDVGLFGDELDAIVDLVEQNIGDKYKEVIENEVKDLQGCKSKKITWLHDESDFTNNKENDKNKNDNNNDKSNNNNNNNNNEKKDEKKDESKDESKDNNENVNKNRFEKRISKSKHFNYNNSDALIEIEIESGKESVKVYIGTDVMSTNQSGYYRFEPSADGTTYLVMENEEGTKKFESIGHLLMGYSDTKQFRKDANVAAIQKGLANSNDKK